MKSLVMEIVTSTITMTSTSYMSRWPITRNHVVQTGKFLQGDNASYFVRQFVSHLITDLVEWIHRWDKFVFLMCLIVTKMNYTLYIWEFYASYFPYLPL